MKSLIALSGLAALFASIFHSPIVALVLLSLVGAYFTSLLIPLAAPAFLKKNMHGKGMITIHLMFIRYA
jgi:hypothetical protein